jgi:hypothetical protein
MKKNIKIVIMAAAILSFAGMAATSSAADDLLQDAGSWL